MDSQGAFVHIKEFDKRTWRDQRYNRCCFILSLGDVAFCFKSKNKGRWHVMTPLLSQMQIASMNIGMPLQTNLQGINYLSSVVLRLGCQGEMT